MNERSACCSNWSRACSQTHSASNTAWSTRSKRTASSSCNCWITLRCREFSSRWRSCIHITKKQAQTQHCTRNTPANPQFECLTLWLSEPTRDYEKTSKITDTPDRACRLLSVARPVSRPIVLLKPKMRNKQWTGKITKETEFNAGERLAVRSKRGNMQRLQFVLTKFDF